MPQFRFLPSTPGFPSPAVRQCMGPYCAECTNSNPFQLPKWKQIPRIELISVGKFYICWPCLANRASLPPPGTWVLVRYARGLAPWSPPERARTKVGYLPDLPLKTACGIAASPLCTNPPGDPTRWILIRRIELIGTYTRLFICTECFLKQLTSPPVWEFVPSRDPHG